jgi:asparagine synthase (glutamine-hydrolysing)
MPGIVGVISRESGADFCEVVATMLHTMRHEPFYESGSCCVPELNVWAGWVAHKDSFAAKEASATFGHPVRVLFAGECFDDGSVGSDGTARSSQVSQYDKLGERWVRDLNGLFSGLLVDQRRGRVWLFNDRYGVDRLYIHETADATYFASEAKALLRVLPSLRSFDDEGVAQFLAFGCPVGGRTLFRGVRLLEGGSLWRWEREGCQKRRYFLPSEWEKQGTLSSEAFFSEFEALFRRILPRYVRGVSPLGLSMTGGLDTRMIVACLPPLDSSPACYTFDGPHGCTLDSRLSKEVALACGFTHQVLRIERDFFADYQRHLDRTVYATDGCAGPVWTHEIYLTARARQLAPIRLTGNYGSEVLRSVSTFKPLHLSPECIAEDFRPHVSGAAAPGGVESPLTFAAFQEIPWKLYGIMAASRSQLSFRTPFLDNDLVALTYQAPVPERQSAESALRLIRASNPTLGRIPTDRALTTDSGGPMQFARRAFAEVTFKLDYLHQEDPPRGLSLLFAGANRLRLLGRHKWLPYRLWFQHELAGFVQEAMTDPATQRLPFSNRRALERSAHLHIAGRRNHVREINAVLTLAAVDRLLLQGEGWTGSDTNPGMIADASVAHQKKRDR